MDSLPNHIQSLLRNLGPLARSDLSIIPWAESADAVYRLLGTADRHFLVKEYRDSVGASLLLREAEIASWVATWSEDVLHIAATSKEERLLLMGPLDHPPRYWEATKEILVQETDLARRVGEALARLHLQGAGAPIGPELLEDRTTFLVGRIKLELQRPAHRHPDLAPTIEAIVREMQDLKQTLVIGGRPENTLLLVEERPLWFGFAAAHYGDPAYDVAGLLGGLLAAACADPVKAEGYIAAAGSLWSAYLGEAGADFGHSGMLQGSLEARLARQLSALLLGLSEGVEGLGAALDTRARQSLRSIGRRLLARPLGRVEGILTQVQHTCTALGPESQL